VHPIGVPARPGVGTQTVDVGPELVDVAAHTRPEHVLAEAPAAGEEHRAAAPRRRTVRDPARTTFSSPSA
jgi:hypothetical protein